MGGGSITRRISNCLPSVAKAEDWVMDDLKRSWTRCLPTIGRVDPREAIGIIRRDGSNERKWWVGQPILTSGVGGGQQWQQQKERIKEEDKDCRYILPDGTAVMMDEPDEGLPASVIGGNVFFEETVMKGDSNNKGNGDGDGIDVDGAASSSSSTYLGVMNGSTLPQMIHSSLTSLDASLRKTMLQNVVLVGSSSRIPGLTNRLQRELQVSDARDPLNTP